jgi:hypothetical protein
MAPIVGELYGWSQPWHSRPRVQLVLKTMACGGALAGIPLAVNKFAVPGQNALTSIVFKTDQRTSDGCIKL